MQEILSSRAFVANFRHLHATSALATSNSPYSIELIEIILKSAYLLSRGCIGRFSSYKVRLGPQLPNKNEITPLEPSIGSSLKSFMWGRPGLGL